MSQVARHKRRVGLGLVAIVAALAGGMGIAPADTVFNDVKSNAGLGEWLAVPVGDTGSATSFWVDASGGGPDCDPADGTALTLTLTSDPAVTLSPSEFTMSACSADGGETAAQSVQVTACEAGDYVVDVSAADADTNDKYNLGQANFKVRAAGDGACDGGGGGGGSSTTAPDVTLLSVSNANWTNAPVDVTWTIDDGGSALTSTSDDCGTDNGDGTWTETVSAESATVDGTLLTCTAGNALGSDSDEATVFIDLTNPTIAGAPTTAPDGDNSWYVSDVTIDWTCGDLLSGVASCPADDVISADGADQTRNGTATDNAGNQASADSTPPVDVDQTDPTTVLSGIVAGSNVATGTTATCAVTDATSGPVNAAPAATYAIVSDPDGDGLGLMSATCSGRDNAGNTSSSSVEYNTTSYGETSTSTCFIRQPISCDNVTVFSRGKSVPTKFRVAGDGPGTLYPNGFNTTQWSVVKVAAPTCKIGDPGGAESVSTQNSTSGGGYVRYDAAQDQYIWNADMRTMPVGSCWKMRVKLAPSDFVGNSAVFKLQK